MDHCDATIQYCPLSADIIEFLREKSVPSWLQASIGECSATGSVDVGPIRIPAMNEIRQLNTDEPWSVFVDSGYLKIGTCLNGDPISVEMDTKKIVIIYHDELWEYFSDLSGVTEPPDVRANMVATGLSFDRFWVEVIADDSFPADAYEAEKRWQRYPLH